MLSKHLPTNYSAAVTDSPFLFIDDKLPLTMPTGARREDRSGKANWELARLAQHYAQ